MIGPGLAGPAGAPGTAARRAPRLHAAVWWRFLLGVVVAILGTVLLVKVVGGSGGPRTTTSLSLTSPVVLAEVTHIPAAVYDEVGIRSPAVPIAAPALVHDGGAVLTWSPASRPRVPVVVFIGTEYNPFSAAERWPLIAALSRFGTFTRLHDDVSSPTDFAPNTPTFSFYDVGYHSDDLVFRPYEAATDVLGPHGYGRLMPLPRAILALQRHEDPALTYPFVDIANQVDVPEVAFSPVTFVGVSRDQVASDLADATNPVTRSIVASANYLTAAICHTDGDRPATVCQSSGVRAATARLRAR